MTVIETERPSFRRIEPRDVDAFARIFADPDVLCFVGDGSTASREETEEWVAREIGRYDEKDVEFHGGVVELHAVEV